MTVQVAILKNFTDLPDIFELRRFFQIFIKGILSEDILKVKKIN